MSVKTQFGEVMDHNYTATEALQGGNLVRFSGNRTVARSTAGSRVAGWVPYDVAAGALVPVYRARRVPVIVAGVVAAGDIAVPANAGQAAALAAAAVADIAAINATRVICGHFETGGASGSEQALVLY